MKKSSSRTKSFLGKYCHITATAWTKEDWYKVYKVWTVWQQAKSVRVRLSHSKDPIADQGADTLVDLLWKQKRTRKRSKKGKNTEEQKQKVQFNNWQNRNSKKGKTQGIKNQATNQGDD